MLELNSCSPCVQVIITDCFYVHAVFMRVKQGKTERKYVRVQGGSTGNLIQKSLKNKGISMIFFPLSHNTVNFCSVKFIH